MIESREYRDKANISHQIWMMVMKLYNENIKSFTMSLKKVGLNPTQFEVMHLIRNQNPIDQKTVATTLNLTQGNITHCIHKLEELGYITFQKEWKTKYLSLSQEGQDLMCQLIPQQHQLMEHSLRGLTCDQKQELHDLLASFESTCKGDSALAAKGKEE